jgi:hypothetical protein
LTTKRTSILNQIKTTLEGVSGMGAVEVNRATPVDIETIAFPCVFVYSGSETRLTDNRSVIGYENWEWQILMEVWGQDQDMEALLGLIHAAMFADEGIGGFAVTSYRTGVDMYVLDPDRARSAMLLSYSVIYRHVRGDMSN